ncbi:GntR family transcriptional regulator [Williamsia sp. CHRR-6]|uniref:GntR family transcriptional regulator n=1 Tax=Williamsia sp. CHRR-6 TaxID=2835871 RepID=UPI001BDA12A5|nr:GntR family transcriptional regulator [Williamsia sp. CHRR-6]MBT0565685.1 GntR family transcriptional regulator [Williamsia sp. CHRR-6]
MAAPLSIRIDRTTPVPLYHQLARSIESAIVAGELSPGDRLENEVDLAKRLGLSRPTIRQAIGELVDKGVLIRKRGVGTQVVQSPVQRCVELTSLYDDLANAGLTPTTQLLEYRVHQGDPDLRRELQLADTTEVVSFTRLRRADGEPLAVMTNHLPADLSPAPGELESDGLYRALRARGIHIRLARQRIGARAAEVQQAELLGVAVGAPLLTMSRTAFDDSGRVVEVGQHVYLANRYFFETTVVSR